ncbi:MAG: DciA family protein [Xanthobacteraceae bacterium]
MSKPGRPFAKPLREVAAKIVGEAFTRQGFASAELVTRWDEIVGPDIAAHSEPIKLQWRSPGPSDAGAGQEPATLVLRVDGPAAIEIQHLGDVIRERVNRFLGWRAVARIVLRQAPLRRRPRDAAPRPDTAGAERISATLAGIADSDLKQALARLGAAIKQKSAGGGGYT